MLMLRSPERAVRRADERRSRQRRMARMGPAAKRVRGLIGLTVGALGFTVGQAAAGGAPSVEELIERFNAAAPVQDGVTVEGWVEHGPAGAELVVRLAPRGEIKLIADPGITVTPRARPGIAWLTEVPYRQVDSEIAYFTPPATVRLPFQASGDAPVELLVEYAYCVVDFQCFFGEETLTVATATP
jgi:hypothetical protein